MEKLDRLFRILRRGGVRRGAEIQRELGISQPVMSRLIREAGPSVSRFGRSVATCYALSREISVLGRQVPVFRVDEQGSPSRHGLLHFLAGEEYWLERASSGEGQPFRGLPPFIDDMRPQGYMGRGFPALFPELKLPGRINDWNDDHHLIALAMRSEDCVGNLIIGEESLDRFLSQKQLSFTRADYHALATNALTGQPGSSAGGEHPKFAVYCEGCHVLVKFAGGDGAAADRWRDLLICEDHALKMLRELGFPAPRSEWFDLKGIRYLEVERFDRIGRQGRCGVISLNAVNNHYIGQNPDNWSRAGKRILDEPGLSLSHADADRLIWLDTFGELIGNSDRHFGNLSFFAEEAKEPNLTLAPVYDMLPMLFAPAAATLVDRQYVARPPSALNLYLWKEVANHALKYWSILSDDDQLSLGFRKIAIHCKECLSQEIGKRA